MEANAKTNVACIVNYEKHPMSGGVIYISSVSGTFIIIKKIYVFISLKILVYDQFFLKSHLQMTGADDSIYLEDSIVT